MSQYMSPALRRAACYSIPRVALAAFLCILAWHGILAFRLQSQPCYIDRVIKHSSAGSDECGEEFSILAGLPGETAVASSIAGLSLAIAMLRLLLAGVHAVPVLCRVLRGTCGQCSVKDLRASIVQLFKTSWRLVSTYVHGSLDPDEVRLRQEVTRLRMRQARADIRRVSFILLPLVYLSGQRFLADAQRGRNGTLIYLYDSEAVPLLFCLSATTLLDAVPSFLNSSSLDWCNVALSAVWCWKFVVMRKGQFLFNETWILVCRIVQSIVCGNARLTMILHGIVSTVCVCSFSQGPFAPTTIWRFRDLQIVNFVVLSVLAWSFEQRHVAEARALMRARHSDHASALVYALLSAMCDAVVKLDADMRLTEPSAKLASLLLREGPQPPGMHFTGLMPPEDAEHFCKHFALLSGEEMEEGEISTPAHVLHTHLNDGNNAKLPVELFYGCVPDDHGQPAYLIGIKEQRDSSGTFNPDDAEPPSDRASSTVNLASLPEAGRVDVSASSSSWSASAESDREREVVHVWIDAASKDLSILGFSSAFALLGGSSGPCGKIQEWASPLDTALLRCWLLQSPKTAFQLQLRPPAAGGQYRVSCKWLERIAGNAPSAPSGADPKCIVLKVLAFSAESTSSPEILGRAHRERIRPGSSSVMSSQTQGSHECSAVSNCKKLEVEEDVCLWFTIRSKHLRILELYGRSNTYCRLFEANKNLCEWPERLEEFQASLHRVLFEFKTGVNRSLPRNFGSFVFKVPLPEPPWPKFLAEAALIDVSDNASSGAPCCVALRAFRALGPAAGPPPRALGRERLAL